MESVATVERVAIFAAKVQAVLLLDGLKALKALFKKGLL